MAGAESVVGFPFPQGAPSQVPPTELGLGLGHVFAGSPCPHRLVASLPPPLPSPGTGSSLRGDQDLPGSQLTLLGGREEAGGSGAQAPVGVSLSFLPHRFCAAVEGGGVEARKRPVPTPGTGSGAGSWPPPPPHNVWSPLQ